MSNIYQSSKFRLLLTGFNACFFIANSIVCFGETSGILSMLFIPFAIMSFNHTRRLYEARQNEKR